MFVFGVYWAWIYLFSSKGYFLLKQKRGAEIQRLFEVSSNARNTIQFVLYVYIIELEIDLFCYMFIVLSIKKNVADGVRLTK